MKDQRMKNYLMPVKLWKKERKTRKMQRASSMRVVMMIKVAKIKQTHKLRKNQLKLLRVLDVQRQNGFLGRNASEGKKRCEIHIMPFFIKMENAVPKTRHKCLKQAKQKQEEALRKQKADEPAEQQIQQKANTEADGNYFDLFE